MANVTIAQVLAASGGEIVGRIRLQKIVYLLDQLGMGSDFHFSYHNYGPYSENVTVAAMREEVLEKVVREEVRPSSYGGTYSIFSLQCKIEPTMVGDLPFNQASVFAKKMKSADSVVLELAATIHWLKEKEALKNWRIELVNRKPNKALPANIDKALDLLKDVGIAA